MKSGRKEFEKYIFVIKITTKLLKYCPSKLIHVMWNIINSWKGKLGIGLRYSILKSRCKQCGNNIFIGPDVEIRNMEQLSIGSNVSIHRFSYIDAAGGISIGDNVSIAHSTSLISFDHTWKQEDIPIKYNNIKVKPIIIKNDVWIGCGVRILKGVLIDERSVVAAGTVVTRDIDKYSISGGIPNKTLGIIKSS